MKNNNSALWQKFYEDLRRDILLSNFQQGQQLTEALLTEKYGVSRTPIRDAFKSLEREGLIEIIHNRGAFVRGFSRREKRDMFDIWYDLETRAIEWAIKRGEKEEFEVLQELYEVLEFYTAKLDTQKVMHIGLSFHEQIIKMARNHVLSSTMETYIDYVRILNSQEFLQVSELSYFLKYHRGILEGMEERDITASQGAFQELIKFVKNNHIL